MLCLGIESSCDETAMAVVEDGTLLGQVLSSQSDVHALFGGVVPELASREHNRFIGVLFDELLEKLGITPDSIDVVGVSRGPGLLGSLLTGVAFGKAVALGAGARFLGVDHLKAHLLVAGLEQEIAYPALGLLVSGGHTQIYRMDSPWAFTLLGQSLDDAAGEVFDKVGALLGLAYPCGKQFDALATSGRGDASFFPRPYLKNDNLDFSFSGLKTAASQFIEAHQNDATSNGKIEDFCASFNISVVETLRVKVQRALDLHGDLQSLVLAGGVAANSLLRKTMGELMQQRGGRLFVPSPELCTDNGAMIAFATWILSAHGFYHDLDMPTIPRGTPVPCDMAIRGNREHLA